LLNRNGRPILMEMTRWIDRKDAKEIQESIAQYSKALAGEMTGGAEQLSSQSSAHDRADTQLLPVVHRDELSHRSNIIVR